MSPSINVTGLHGPPAPLDAVGGQVFTRDIEHTFENRVILMMREVLL
jgi:hypothetical protein